MGFDGLYSQMDKSRRLDNELQKANILRPPVHLILEASCGLPNIDW